VGRIGSPGAAMLLARTNLSAADRICFGWERSDRAFGWCKPLECDLLNSRVVARDDGYT
jgi:hypothetical protein